MTQPSDQLCQCGGKYGLTRSGDDLLCSRCKLPLPGYEAKASGGLTFFRGGPLDGKAYPTDSFLSTEITAQLPVDQYRWTREKVTSELTGQTARVWEWQGPPEALLPVRSANGNEESSMSQNTTAEGVTNTQLFERRKSLGLSRSVVANKAGITQAQLGSMETSGKRVKEGIMDAVHNALNLLETERGTTSEPSDKEDHTPATV